MKMKYGEIYSLYDSLMRMRDVTGFKVAWAVAKNIKNLETEARFFEEQRDKLIRRYGKEEGGTLMIKRDSENFQSFIEEYEELNKMETDVDLYTITDDIDEKDFHCDTAKASDFLLLMKYIVKKEEPAQN